MIVAPKNKLCYNQYNVFLGALFLKYIKQILIILLFSFLGELLAKAIPLPIPAAIYGFILLFLSLFIGLVKESDISETASFLISGMGILFVAPAVNILSYFGLIAPALVPICIIVVSSTFVVFGVSGLVTQAFLKKGDKNDG